MAIETIRPTGAYNPGSWADPTYGYDNDVNTAASKDTPETTPSISFGGAAGGEATNSWQSKVKSWTAATLYVTFSKPAGTDDTVSITVWDKASGTTKHTVLAATSGEVTKQEFSQALDSADWGGAGFPNIANLRLRVNGVKVGGSDKKKSFLYEVRIDGQYTPPVIETIRPTDAHNPFDWTDPYKAWDGNIDTCAVRNNDVEYHYIRFGGATGNNSINSWQTKTRPWDAAKIYVTVYLAAIGANCSGGVYVDAISVAKHTIAEVTNGVIQKQEFSQVLDSADWGGAGFPNIANLRLRARVNIITPPSGWAGVYEVRIEGECSPAAIDASLAMPTGAGDGYEPGAPIFASKTMQAGVGDGYDGRAPGSESRGLSSGAGMSFVPGISRAADRGLSSGAGISLLAESYRRKSIKEMRERGRLNPVYLVDISLKNSGPTLYFSDRNVDMAGTVYENYLESLEGLGSELKRSDSSALNADITLRFKNDRFGAYDRLIGIGETYPFEGAVCTISEAYLDDRGVPSVQETVFRGALDAPEDIDAAGFKCRVSSMPYFKDRTWKQDIVEKTSYPEAEDAGRTVPIAYGGPFRLPALKLGWGGRSTLKADIASTATSGIELSDGSKMPAAGTLLLDKEEISYTGMSSNVLSGVTRGANGTTATAHKKGADVWQKKSTYYSLLAGHDVYSSGDIYAEVGGKLLRVTEGVSAYHDGLYCVLSATEQIKIDKADMDAIYTPSQKRLVRKGDGLPKALVSSGTENIYFQSKPSAVPATNIKAKISWEVAVREAPGSNVVFRLNSSSGPKIATVLTDGTVIRHLDSTFEVSLSSWGLSPKVVLWKSHSTSYVVFTVYDAEISGDINTIDPHGGIVTKEATNLPLQWTGGTARLSFPSEPEGSRQTAYIRVTWSVGVEANPSSEVTLRIPDSILGNPVIAKVKPDGTVVKYVGSTFQQNLTTVGTPPFWSEEKNYEVLNGSSGVVWTISAADESCNTDSESSASVPYSIATHTVDRFHVVVSGYKDPDGNYGGIGTLVERPDYVIKHFLVRRLGFGLTEIDAASFDAAGSFYASNGYKFAFAVTEKIKPSEFIERLARECRSVLRYKAGKWHLDVIPSSAPSALKTISASELAGEGSKFVFSKTPVTEIANDLTARFKRSYSRVSGESDWDGTAKASSSASKTKFGTYPKEYDFEFVRLQAMANSVLSHMLTESGAPRLTVRFPVLWEHFDLAVGDTVEITNSLYGGRKFFIEEIRRSGRARAEVKAVEWW